MFKKLSIRPTGQLKAGFDYHINEDVNMHIRHKGFGVFGSSKYKTETLKFDSNFSNGKG